MRLFRVAARCALILTVSSGTIVADAQTSADTRRLEQAAQSGDAAAQLELADDYNRGGGVRRDAAAAAFWYCKAALHGNARAAYVLGLLYDTGRGVGKNEVESVAWLRIALDGGNPDAERNLGAHYLDGRGVEKDEQKGLALFNDAVQKGDVWAEYQLSTRYESGEGVPKDAAQALQLLKKGADGGYSFAQYELGVHYASGRLVPRDDAQALSWYRKSANQGLSEAELALGDCYRDGRGTAPDAQESVRWYLRAAEDGDPDAQVELGWDYETGEGVRQDYKLAAAWYLNAATVGNVGGQSDLGYLYANGKGVPRDPSEAIRWFELAAANGDAYALFMLSGYYETGVGLPLDPSQALTCLRQGAEGGNKDAEYKLGTLYERGDGVPKDLKLATSWLGKAADQGYEAARQELDRLTPPPVPVKPGPPMFTATIHIRYNGKPYIPPTLPYITVLNTDTGKGVEPYQIVWTGGDTVTVSRLENGHYLVEITIGARATNHLMYLPGSLTTRSNRGSFEIAGADIEFDCHEVRLIHIIKPIDNRQLLPASGPLPENCPPLVVPSATALAWEPIELPRVTYIYSIAKFQCTGTSTVIEYGETTKTSVPFMFHPQPGESYSIALTAKTPSDDDVGEVRFVGEQWYGTGGYQFALPTAGAPAEHKVTVHLAYNGKPLVPKTRPDMFINNMNTRELVAEKQIEWNGDTITAWLPNGHYVLEVAARESASRKYLPGGFYNQLFFTVDNADADLVSAEARLIHVIQPVDNAKILADDSNGCLPFLSLTPTRLSWEPVDVPDTKYRYDIARLSCKDTSVQRHEVAGGETTSTSIPLTLPPSADGEYYAITISGRSPSHQEVGALMSVAPNWFTWSIRFRVPPPQ